MKRRQRTKEGIEIITFKLRGYRTEDKLRYVAGADAQVSYTTIATGR